MRLGHHSHRRSFVLVLVACWTIGFFGLSGGRVSFVQLAVVGATLLAWGVLGARRRRIESARERWLRSGLQPSPPSSNVRRLGDFST